MLEVFLFREPDASAERASFAVKKPDVAVKASSSTEEELLDAAPELDETDKDDLDETDKDLLESEEEEEGDKDLEEELRALDGTNNDEMTDSELEMD